LNTEIKSDKILLSHMARNTHFWCHWVYHKMLKLSLSYSD
jgi:hypothetical protein